MTTTAAIALLGEIAQLEPIAVGLVTSLISGLKGKTDAEILAADASDWAAIVSEAHDAASQPPPSVR
jgi:hypothetical protein